VDDDRLGLAVFIDIASAGASLSLDGGMQRRYDTQQAKCSMAGKTETPASSRRLCCGSPAWPGSVWGIPEGVLGDLLQRQAVLDRGQWPYGGPFR
jgi:hypothetical protein